MMQTDTLTVLIISFNSWFHLNNCIRSVQRSDHSVHEILVIDNASVDDSSEKLRRSFPDVHLIQNRHNIGHAQAVRQGFAAARGSRILLLDADTELDRNAIRIMSDYLDEHPEVCMVAPRTYYPDGTVQQTARNFPSAINGIFGRQSLLTRLFPNNPFSRRYLSRESLDSSKPFQVEFISAACMFFRTSVLDTVGTWDKDFHGYWVDADWCKRIQNSGGIIQCVPDASIIHHEQNKGMKKKDPRRIIDFHKGAFRFYRLHYTIGNWDPRCWIAFILLTARSLVLLAANKCKKSTETVSDPLSHKES
jgi:GT2 family glycosyltransferase